MYSTINQARSSEQASDYALFQVDRSRFSTSTNARRTTAGMPPKRAWPLPGLAAAPPPPPKRLQVTRGGFHGGGGGGGEASMEPAAAPRPPSPRERQLRSAALVLCFVVQLQVKGDRRHKRLRRVIRTENAISQKKILEEVDHTFWKYIGPIYRILESFESRINVLCHALGQIERRSNSNNYDDECPRSEENQEHAAVFEEANHGQTTAVDKNNEEQTGFDGLTKSEVCKGAAIQLCFLNEMKSLVYTGQGIKDKSGAAIKITIYEDNNQIKSGPLSSVRVEIMAINGDFANVVPSNWTEEDFNRQIVSCGKDSALGGDCLVKLKNGEASLGRIFFKIVSSKTHSGKLILAARVHSSDKAGYRVKEAVMNPVRVQVSRNEQNQKCNPPKLKDDIFRLNGISRMGPHFERLQRNNISTVEAFLKALNRDEEQLCKECFKLNKDSKSWENIVNHARQCDFEGNHKLKSYIFADESVILFFDCVYDLVGAEFSGCYKPKGKFDPDQLDLVNRLKKVAHNILDSIEYDHIMEGNRPTKISANLNICEAVSFPMQVTSQTNPFDHFSTPQDANPNFVAGAMVPERDSRIIDKANQSSGQLVDKCFQADNSGVEFCTNLLGHAPLVMAKDTTFRCNNLPGMMQDAVEDGTDDCFSGLGNLLADYGMDLYQVNLEARKFVTFHESGFNPSFCSGNNPFGASTSTENVPQEHNFSQNQNQHMQRQFNEQSDGPSAYLGSGYNC